jgi:hypothetical protein
MVGSPVVSAASSKLGWKERDTKWPWRGRAFVACRIAGSAGAACRFAALGEYTDSCTASIDGAGKIHYTCTSAQETATGWFALLD